MPPPKVLIADELSPAAIEVFTRKGIEADVRTGLGPEELGKVIAGYDALAVRSATKVTEPLLAAAPRLKVVGRAGIGVDNVDVKAATRRGIIVMNTPHGNAVTTAEHTLALLFALARQIPAADASTRAGKWEKSKFLGTQLAGKTLGLIGCGNIGSIVAARALALDMRVLAYDPFLSPERAGDLGVEKVEFDELLRRADILTLHTPLTDRTRHMIDAAALSRCKPGVRIVNCARGGLVDEAALAEALRSGQVSGAALDVYETEPARENILFGFPQVVFTPHLGASTVEAQENVAVQIAEQIASYLLTGAITNAVNFPSLSVEEAKWILPWVTLAGQLGSFAGQLTETAILGVRLEYLGDIGRHPVKPLTAAALAGLLKPSLEDVNMVSAAALATSRGITVEEVLRPPEGGFDSSLRLTVRTKDFERHVAGTVFAGTRPRIIEVRGIAMDFEVTPCMLFVRNRDTPGFIGAFGTLMGEAGINIATMNLGRERPGGDAICVVALDGPVSDATLAKVAALPHVVRVRRLSF